MAEFAVKVVEITEPVIEHPNADRLNIVKVLGFEAIANKLEDGSPRYRQGDKVVYIPEASLLPVWLLKKLDMWNEEAGKGYLSGPLGNRVKAMKLRGIVSQGVMLKVEGDGITVPSLETVDGTVVGDSIYGVAVGDDVAEILGVTKYEPPIPIALAGEVCNIHGKTMRFDFENLKMVPDIFEPGEIVIATEKRHGTHCQIGYIPGLNHPELFAGGDFYVASKGLGGQGFVLKDVAANDGNLYAKALRALLATEDFMKIKDLLTPVFGGPVHIFGEIFGAGVQKNYGYGVKTPSFEVFDIAMNGHFLPHDKMVETAHFLGLKVVPVLYGGPFDIKALEVFRDGLEPGAKVPGKDALTGTTTREGIVVKAVDGSRHPAHGRKVAKMINPAYLLKTDGEEFN